MTARNDEGGFRAVRVARPSQTGRLSGGLVVEASILARLLGIRLLRLEAHIAFVPVDFPAFDHDSTADPYPAEFEYPAELEYPAEFDRYPAEQMTEHGEPSARPGSLRDAAKLVEHASRTLDETQREALGGLRP